ncbi:MAG TPA: M28 family peptidase, partial [Gemmatimonadaceae bacterium]|nr:M28 family peptidase [Gemmatimonadaceae bacterium]
MTFRQRRISHVLGLIVLATAPLAAQQRSQGASEATQFPAPPPSVDPRIYQIVAESSPERIEADIRRLAGFGTRNTFSDTVSATRGIGAARRWIKDEFDRISQACGGCLEVRFQEAMHGEGERRVNVVNVIATLRGTQNPNRYVIMSGDIDSRASNTFDGQSDAPGANDNASGMAGVIEAARLLAKHRFGSSIIFVGLSGEEQGLWGGQTMAAEAKAQ